MAFAATIWSGTSENKLYERIKSNKAFNPQHALHAKQLAEMIDKWLREEPDPLVASKFMKDAAEAVLNSKSIEEAEGKLKGLCNALLDKNQKENCLGSITEAFEMQPNDENFKTWLWEVLQFATEREAGELQYIHVLLIIAVILYVMAKLILSNESWCKLSTKEVINIIIYLWTIKYQREKNVMLQFLSPDYRSKIDKEIDNLQKLANNIAARTILSGVRFADLLIALMNKYLVVFKNAINDHHFNNTARQALKVILPAFESSLKEVIVFSQKHKSFFNFSPSAIETLANFLFRILAPTPIDSVKFEEELKALQLTRGPTPESPKASPTTSRVQPQSNWFSGLRARFNKSPSIPDLHDLKVRELREKESYISECSANPQSDFCKTKAETLHKFAADLHRHKDFKTDSFENEELNVQQKLVQLCDKIPQLVFCEEARQRLELFNRLLKG